MKAYKGFDKNLKCRGFQYKEGGEYETERAKLCECGFHACEMPLNVWDHYPPVDGNRFCEVKQSGDVKRNGDGGKSVSTKLKVVAEIGMPGLVKAQIDWTRNQAKDIGKKSGDGAVLAGGNHAKLAGGDGAVLAGGNHAKLAGGYNAKLAGGYNAKLAGGDCAKLAGGDCATLAGGYNAKLAGGDCAKLAGGDCAKLAGGYNAKLAGGVGATLAGGDGAKLAGGKSSICVGGAQSMAKGGLYSVLVLTDWEWVGNDYVPMAVKAIIIDGKTYKPDTWYVLRGGEVVEVKDKEDDNG